MLQEKKLFYSIESSKPNSSYQISNQIFNVVINEAKNKDIIVMCIGTDRSTGDCLGPLVGDKLSKFQRFSNINVFGTLDNPVHAKNLDQNLEYVYSRFENPYIIAVDASLGKFENIGKINLYYGPLFPGAGVNKKLTPVGDISITGIVNMSGFMEYMILQNTRLSLVMKMADTISFSLYAAFKKYCEYINQTSC